MDEQSVTALRQVAAERAGVPDFADWLRGTDITALEQDAQRFAAKLGVAPPEARQRDKGGRFAASASQSMTNLIRARAGRGAT